MEDSNAAKDKQRERIFMIIVEEGTDDHTGNRPGDNYRPTCLTGLLLVSCR